MFSRVGSSSSDRTPAVRILLVGNSGKTLAAIYRSCSMISRNPNLLPPLHQLFCQAMAMRRHMGQADDGACNLHELRARILSLICMLQDAGRRVWHISLRMVQR